jgi:hypothetical protein
MARRTPIRNAYHSRRLLAGIQRRLTVMASAPVLRRWRPRPVTLLPYRQVQGMSAPRDVPGRWPGGQTRGLLLLRSDYPLSVPLAGVVPAGLAGVLPNLVASAGTVPSGWVAGQGAGG